ncbi:Zinc finger protein 26-like 12 [Homarus americanus]|nr:Zinc finger protein 26-like 12 [Homarus americanus]
MADNLHDDDGLHDVKPNFGYWFDVEEATRQVSLYEEKTGTRFGFQREDANFGTGTLNNEDCRIQWEENEKYQGERLVFDGVPFVVLGTRHLGCQYGIRNAVKKDKYIEWRKEHVGHNSPPRRGSCPAKVILKEVIKFPDYKIDANTNYEKKKWSKVIRDDLVMGTAHPQQRIYVELPDSEAHVHSVLLKKVSEDTVSRPNPLHCLICNGKLLTSARSAVTLFSEEARTSHRQLELHSVLSDIIDQELEEEMLHSSIVCSKCFNLIDDIDSLEEQLVNKKQMVANRYKRTVAEINQSPESPASFMLDDDDFADAAPFGKRKGRGRGRGRPPGRPRGRGRGRPRGRPKGSAPIKSPEKCIVKLELEPADDNGLENVTFFSALKSPPSLKTIKKEDIMSDLETPDHQQKTENIEDTGTNVDDMIDEVSGADMPLVDGDVAVEIQGDVLEVVEEVLEEEVKQGKRFSCSECEKQFLTKAAVRNHIKVHNRLDSYDCEECEKSFATKYRLKAHLKTHIDRDRPHKCRVCNKSFYTRYHLNTHMRSHEGVRNFVCELCGKALSTQKTLELHALTHTGEKPFQCEICGSTFRQRSNLLTHIKATHYQEKNYHCQMCQKSFVRKRLLVYHMNSVHTGQRPYKCELCNASFVYPHYYKRHLRKHTGIKPHKCNVCGKTFASRENRNAHMFIHSDKKPYECKICGAGFMRKPLCVSHLANHGHTENAEDYILFNSPSLLVGGHEELIVAEDEEAARAVHAVRMAEETSAQETIVAESTQIMRDTKVVKVMSRPVHIIEADDTTRYVIHSGDRVRDENMEHFFAALQGQVVEVRTEDF